MSTLNANADHPAKAGPASSRFILTGAPGSGKTVLLRSLEHRGVAVVEEAATDVIAWRQALGVDEPWREADFIDSIVRLQQGRQHRSSSQPGVQVFDRSPVCTLALSRHLDLPPSAALQQELERIHLERTYDRRVFFVRNLGFCRRTEARRISFEDSLRFEQVHAEVYAELGYELVEVPAEEPKARVLRVLALLRQASAAAVPS